MISNIYHIEGLYPDPQEVESELQRLKSDPEHERLYKESLKEIKDAGLDKNPILRRFFVES